MTDEQFEKLLKEVRWLKITLSGLSLVVLIAFIFIPAMKAVFHDPVLESSRSQAEMSQHLQSLSREVRLLRESQERRAGPPVTAVPFVPGKKP